MRMIIKGSRGQAMLAFFSKGYQHIVNQLLLVSLFLKNASHSVQVRKNKDYSRQRPISMLFFAQEDHLNG